MSWQDDRPSYWGSGAMWFKWAGASVAALLAQLLTQERPDSSGPLIAVLIGAAALAVFVPLLSAGYRRRRRFAADAVLASVMVERAAVVALPPVDAFDAARQALEAIRGARIDLVATRVADGTLRATTPWGLLTNGERIDVRLKVLDMGHVAVFATCNPKYRGALQFRIFNDERLIQFFSALPLERPYMAWTAPSSRA